MTFKLEITVPSYEIVYDRKRLMAVLRGAGQEVAAVARALLGRSKTGKGDNGASAPGEPPASRTGNLLKSVKSRMLSSKFADGVRIFDDAQSPKGFPYAVALEKGAYGGGGRKGSGKARQHRRLSAETRRLAATTRRAMLPRPFLSTALESRENDIAERIKTAVMDGIKFQKVKA